MLLEKSFRSFFVIFSLFLFSCNSAPKVTLCVSSPKDDGFACVDHEENESFLSYEESENYVAVSPDDFRTLVEWAKLKCEND